jgi:ribonuclease HI
MDLSLKYLGRHLDFGVRFGGAFHYSDGQLIHQFVNLITTNGPGNNLALLTDSLSALHALQVSTSDQLQINISRLLQSRRVVLQWIPAHVGVPGNERRTT